MRSWRYWFLMARDLTLALAILAGSLYALVWLYGLALRQIRRF